MSYRVQIDARLGLCVRAELNTHVRGLLFLDAGRGRRVLVAFEGCCERSSSKPRYSIYVYDLHLLLPARRTTRATECMLVVKRTAVLDEGKTRRRAAFRPTRKSQRCGRASFMLPVAI